MTRAAQEVRGLPRRATRRVLAHARGFSLVELMVALAIGLLLTSGALGIYTNSRTTLQTTERLAQLQDNTRFILDLMEPDVRAAGFWGLTNRTDFVAGRAGPAD